MHFIRIGLPICVYIVLGLLASNSVVMAEVPSEMSYQGFLRNEAGEPVTGDVNFLFYIYADSVGDVPRWGPEAHVGKEVVDGFFELQLGSIESGLSTCFDGTRRWLEIWVNGAPLDPRKPISSSAYAFLAPSGGVVGSGTQDFVAKFTDATTIEDSQIYDDGALVGIGTMEPTEKLDVAGTIHATGIKMSTGAISGYVLTSDTDGTGTWEPTSTPPIGSIVAWMKSMQGTPPIPEDWLECNGQVVSDPESPYDGESVPDLNGAGEPKRFLRGSLQSGATGGSEIHGHPPTDGGGQGPAVWMANEANHLPPYYEVVWTIKVK